MKPVININKGNLIKIFNTVSHILFHEIYKNNSKMKNLTALKDDRYKIYCDLVKQEIPLDSFGENFYSIHIPNEFKKLSFTYDPNDKIDGDLVYISFIDGKYIDNKHVMCYYVPTLFKDSIGEIHILVNNNITDVEQSIDYIRSLYMSILLYYADIKVKGLDNNTVVSPKDREVFSIVRKIADIFANLIIENENLKDETIKNKVATLYETHVDLNSAYMKLKNNEESINIICEGL